MGFHPFPVLPLEFAGIFENAGGNADLAEIVQNSAHMDCLPVFLVESAELGQ